VKTIDILVIEIKLLSTIKIYLNCVMIIYIQSNYLESLFQVVMLKLRHIMKFEKMDILFLNLKGLLVLWNVEIAVITYTLIQLQLAISF